MRTKAIIVFAGRIPYLFPMINVAVGVIMNGEGTPGGRSVLLCQRRSSARYPLKWEFPGGKVERGESIEDCLRRELHEELAIDATIGPLFHRQVAEYPDSGIFDVRYHLVSSFSGIPVNNVFETVRWVPLGDLGTYDILEGNRDVIGKLLQSNARP